MATNIKPFNKDLLLKEGFQVWKQRYLFPFANIAPLHDFQQSSKLDPVLPTSGSAVLDSLESVKSPGTIESLPSLKRLPDEEDPSDVFDSLIFRKYRMTIDDMGGYLKSKHWLEELSRPLLIKEEEVNRDLHVFVNEFPMDLIPFKSNLENKIAKAKKEITQIKIDKLHLEKARSQLQQGEFGKRMMQLSMKESFWKTQHKQSMELRRIEQQNRLEQKKQERKKKEEAILSSLPPALPPEFGHVEPPKVPNDSDDEDSEDEEQMRSKLSKPFQHVHYKKKNLRESEIKFAFEIVKAKEVSKLIGIMAHFVYWAVFGGFNSLPIDRYHMETMYKTMFEQTKSLEKTVEKRFLDRQRARKLKQEQKSLSPERRRSRSRPREDLSLRDIKSEIALQNSKKLFHTLIFPLLLMIIRVELDKIFTNFYSKFFNNIGPSGRKEEKSTRQVRHLVKAWSLMNGVVTEILDPNIYYSRFSFLESSKDAIDIKHKLHMGKQVGFHSYKLPKISQKYYTRSSLMKNFFGQSSEGHIRSKFSHNLDAFKAKLTQQRQTLQDRHYRQMSTEQTLGTAGTLNTSPSMGLAIQVFEQNSGGKEKNKNYRYVLPKTTKHSVPSSIEPIEPENFLQEPPGTFSSGPVIGGRINLEKSHNKPLHSQNSQHIFDMSGLASTNRTLSQYLVGAKSTEGSHKNPDISKQDIFQSHKDSSMIMPELNLFNSVDRFPKPKKLKMRTHHQSKQHSVGGNDSIISNSLNIVEQDSFNQNLNNGALQGLGKSNLNPLLLTADSEEKIDKLSVDFMQRQDEERMREMKQKPKRAIQQMLHSSNRLVKKRLNEQLWSFSTSRFMLEKREAAGPSDEQLRSLPYREPSI